MNVYTTDRIRNVVLLGHGGCGKTSLVEAMAYLAGMTTRMGKVADGNTISDYDKEEIKRGIESYKTVGSRSNVIRKETVTIIDDCYNANPMSMKASLGVLNDVEERCVAILGDMGELGENEAALHREVGEYAGEQNIDEYIVVGNISKETKETADDLLVKICFLKELHDLMYGDTAVLNFAFFNVCVESIHCSYFCTAVVAFANEFKANTDVDVKFFNSSEVSVTAEGANAEETVAICKMLVVL